MNMYDGYDEVEISLLVPDWLVVPSGRDEFVVVDSVAVVAEIRGC